MIRTRSAGGIVLGDGGTIVLVRYKNSAMWLFPKGHVEEGETDEAAARREIQEETGLTQLEYLDDLGEYERPPGRMLPGQEEEIKTIKMFLFAAWTHAILKPTLEIEEARWFPFREMGERIGIEKDRVWFMSVAPRVREAIKRD